MDSSLAEGVKKVFFAGVGAVVLTAEKAGELLDEMAEKGESALDNGKALNRELKRTVKENPIKKTGEEKDLSKIVAGLSEDELSKLKEIIAKKENKE